MTSILLYSNMDFIQRSSVKFPNAVIVGITESVQDEEVIGFLQKYGAIQCTLLVEDESSDLHKNRIVEYASGSAVQAMQSLLPYRHTLKSDSNVVYNVEALSSVYTSKLGSSATKTYLTELKELAKLSGKDYEAVLREMMMHIGSDVESMQSAKEPSPLVLSEFPVESPQPTSPFSGPPQNDSGENSAMSAPVVDQRRVPSLSASDVNPPEVQKVVVEHIVRRGDAGSFSSFPVRLRSFSGKIPRPNSEVDYDTWRSHIDLLLNDPSMSPLQVSRRILESLLSPAADVVRGLCSNSLPSAYLQLLDSAFGAVEDGEELFAQFMSTLQDPGEKPSAYLQRLQLMLNQAVKRGGGRTRGSR